MYLLFKWGVFLAVRRRRHPKLELIYAQMIDPG